MSTMMKHLLLQSVLMMAVKDAHKPSGGGKPVAGELVREEPQNGKPLPGTQVAKPASTAVGAAINYEEDAGQGTEGADKDSFAIPFLVVLQPLSPVVVDKLVEGAEAGMFMNSVTNQLYRNPVIVPCSFQRRFVRWGARETGGGYKGEMTVAESVKERESGAVKELDNRLYYPMADGSINEKKSDKLQDTRNHFVIILEDEQDILGTPAVLAMASTHIKCSKTLMSRIEGLKLPKADGTGVFTPPAYYSMFKLKTVKKTNEKGTWFLPEVAPAGKTDDIVYELAKKFYNQVMFGKVDLATDSLKTASDTSSDGEGKGF